MIFNVFAASYKCKFVLKIIVVNECRDRKRISLSASSIGLTDYLAATVVPPSTVWFDNCTEVLLHPDRVGHPGRPGHTGYTGHPSHLLVTGHLGCPWAPRRSQGGTLHPLHGGRPYPFLFNKTLFKVQLLINLSVLCALAEALPFPLPPPTLGSPMQRRRLTGKGGEGVLLHPWGQVRSCLLLGSWGWSR